MVSKSEESGSGEQVLTHNLNYSLCRLLPQDTRERDLFHRFRVLDIGDIYKYLIPVLLFNPLQDALEYN